VSQQDDIASGTEQISEAELISEPVPDETGFRWWETQEDSPEQAAVTSAADAGRIIDAEIIDEEQPRSRLKSGDDIELSDKVANAGVPKVDDFLRFFSRVLLRGATDWYIDWIFADVDENVLSDREIQRIHLSQEERDEIARPFAELSSKVKFMRKHGRTIIASGDSFHSALILMRWFNRTNRIARKYKPKVEVNGGSPRSGQPRSQDNGHRPPVGDFQQQHYSTGTG
jgi:hypothetical protein